MYRRRLSRFWSLTASTPACFASTNSSCAFSTEPWWLWPISAMTKHGVSSAIRRPSISSSRTGRSYPVAGEGLACARRWADGPPARLLSARLAAACGASLLRLRGIVSFALAVAVLVFAEIVAVSHALSLFGVYARGWFLVAVGALAVAAVVTAIVLRPPWPSSVVSERSRANSAAIQSSQSSSGSSCSSSAT